VVRIEPGKTSKKEPTSTGGREAELGEESSTEFLFDNGVAIAARIGAFDVRVVLVDREVLRRRAR